MMRLNIMAEHVSYLIDFMKMSFTITTCDGVIFEVPYCITQQSKFLYNIACCKFSISVVIELNFVSGVEN